MPTPVDPGSWGGCLLPRAHTSSTSISSHARGCAVLLAERIFMPRLPAPLGARAVSLTISTLGVKQRGGPVMARTASDTGRNAAPHGVVLVAHLELVPGVTSRRWPHLQTWPPRLLHGTAPRMARTTQIIERALPVAALVVALVGAPILIFSPQGLPRLRGLQKELADVDDENADLRRDIDSLRGRVIRLRDDPGAVERIARDNLGLVRQNEVVFQFQTRR